MQVIIGTSFEVTLDMIKTLNISYVVRSLPQLSPPLVRSASECIPCPGARHALRCPADARPVSSCACTAGMSLWVVMRRVAGTRCRKNSIFSERLPRLWIYRYAWACGNIASQSESSPLCAPPTRSQVDTIISRVTGRDRAKFETKAEDAEGRSEEYVQEL